MHGTGGKTLRVNTESDITAGDEVIIDTNKRFRKFLDGTYRIIDKGTGKTVKKYRGRIIFLTTAFSRLFIIQQISVWRPFDPL